MVISKCLEKKIEVIPENEMLGFKSPMELEYYLVESESKDCDELKGKKVYGIEIVKKALNKEERKLIKNFSCCKDNTRNVLNKLVDNTVTPVALPFILDDILGAL